jgi:hypothetical protein
MEDPIADLLSLVFTTLPPDVIGKIFADGKVFASTHIRCMIKMTYMLYRHVPVFRQHCNADCLLAIIAEHRRWWLAEYREVGHAPVYVQSLVIGLLIKNEGLVLNRDTVMDAIAKYPGVRPLLIMYTISKKYGAQNHLFNELAALYPSDVNFIVSQLPPQLAEEDAHTHAVAFHRCFKAMVNTTDMMLAYYGPGLSCIMIVHDRMTKQDMRNFFKQNRRMQYFVIEGDPSCRVIHHVIVPGFNEHIDSLRADGLLGREVTTREFLKDLIGVKNHPNCYHATYCTCVVDDTIYY